MKYVLELDIVWQTIRQLHMLCIYSKKNSISIRHRIHQQLASGTAGVVRRPGRRDGSDASKADRLLIDSIGEF